MLGKSSAVQLYEDLVTADSLADGGIDGEDLSVERSLQADLHLHRSRITSTWPFETSISRSDVDGADLAGHGRG